VTAPDSAKILLVSAPWPLYTRPSIQLATLKAYLQKSEPGLQVSAAHVYLRVARAVGYRTYHEVSERTWLAESVFAALLYPQRLPVIERFFRKRQARDSTLAAVDFRNLTATVETEIGRFVDEQSWERYRLVGFSLCLCQFTASLYLIRHIKARCPHLPVVVGGSMFAGRTLLRLLQRFSEIDVGINGEGERPLAGLVCHLIQGGELRDLQVPGVVTRVSSRAQAETFDQLENLDELPLPDFEDYFQLLASLGPEEGFFPTLPVEISRGCWWRKPSAGRNFNGCAFCNLNLQWRGYRSKTPDRVGQEVDSICGRHRSLSLAVTDNLIPSRGCRAIFGKLARSPRDLRIFCEIRAHTPLRTLQTMSAAGVKELQIGIESLSSRLLQKMNKGTAAIENLEIMKHCEAVGLVNVSNLIIGFPGSDADDVAQTLQCLEFAQFFRPLRCVRFWLGFGSPVWSQPARFDIRAVYNHPYWSRLFPPQDIRGLQFMIQDYRGDKMRQRKLWAPVEAKVRQWHKSYRSLHRQPYSEPILSYRDGGDFMIIRQRRAEAEPLTHRLVGPSRGIYRFCEHNRTSDEIRSAFPEISREQLDNFLTMMVSKRLVYSENERYLSLAVRTPSGGSVTSE